MQGLDIHVTIDGFKEIDFDSKVVRKAIRHSAGKVRAYARRLIARRAISAAGEFPGKDTGTMQKAIVVRMARPRGGRGGLWATVQPIKTADMKNFYPAILVAGVKGGPRDKSHRTKPGNGSWRIAPRENFMIEALAKNEVYIREQLQDSLYNSLVARK